MAEVRGKFIKITGFLMKPNEVIKADDYLVSVIGVPHSEVKDEGWYDTEIFNRFKEICAEESLLGEKIYFFIGTQVYPTIKRTAGFPPELKTPSDFIKFEAAGYLFSHRGESIVPRTFIHEKEGNILMKASTPGYKPDFMRGVFAGILKMCGVKSGEVEYMGDDQFHITW